MYNIAIILRPWGSVALTTRHLSENLALTSPTSCARSVGIVRYRTQATEFFNIVYNIPPLWSSGQSSWLQIRRPGFDSQHYQKKKVVRLEGGPLSLVSTTEELIDRKVAAPVQKTENTAVGIRHADHVAPSISKSWHTSPTSGGRSVGIVRSRTETMEFFFYIYNIITSDLIPFCM
jgi:hypothetical protein